MARREKPTCPKCGSDDIGFDATAYWDVEKQSFYCEPCDEAWCNACDWPDSFTPKWVELSAEDD